MVSRSFSLLFFIRKQKDSIKKSAGTERKKALIYIRITVDGKRTEVSTKRNVDPVKWNSSMGRVAGTREEVKTLNSYLDTLERMLHKTYQELIEGAKPVTSETIKKRYLGVADERPRMLIQIIQEHNDGIKKLIGFGYSKPTWIKYNTTQKHITEFLQSKYSITDIPIKNLNFEFINDFEFYLKAEKHIDINTNAKYIKNLKKIIRECVAKDWLTKDPFLAYKVKTKRTQRVFLSDTELAEIERKVFSMERLNIIRDIFLFSCYTGLSYIDAYHLTPDNIVVGLDGERWIHTARQKTQTPSHVPLLNRAMKIIEKYADHPKTLNQGKLLPFSSNQKVNAYLKEIAVCCSIKKELTFHVARHTFATTVTLNNGVSMESVSKMLGHKKLQTTEIYAKILDKKVSNEMLILKKRMYQAV